MVCLSSSAAVLVGVAALLPWLLLSGDWWIFLRIFLGVGSVLLFLF